jgi:hypothetical protein
MKYIGLSPILAAVAFPLGIAVVILGVIVLLAG